MLCTWTEDSSLGSLSDLVGWSRRKRTVTWHDSQPIPRSAIVSMLRRYQRAAPLNRVLFSLSTQGRLLYLTH